MANGKSTRRLVILQRASGSGFYLDDLLVRVSMPTDRHNVYKLTVSRGDFKRSILVHPEERARVGKCFIYMERSNRGARKILVRVEAPEEITVLREELVDGKKGDKNEKFHHRFHTRIDREQDTNQSQKRSGD